MPFIAPLLLSILTHVVFALSTVLVTILSMWTQRRVRMAASSVTAFQAPVFKPRSISFRKRRPAPIVFGDVKFGAPLQRSQSVGSAPVMKCDTPTSPKCQPYRIPSSPLVTSPVISATEKADFALLPAFSLGDRKSAYWMHSSSAPSSPSKEDYFNFEPNSPTGSLLDGSTCNAPAWASGESIFDSERRSAGRKIIVVLCLFRLCVTFPLIWLEAKLGHFSVSRRAFCPVSIANLLRFQMPRLFLASDDLLLVDCVASVIVSAGN